MRIAIVHDWLTGTRGGERILEALCEMLPTATIFSLLHVPGTVSKAIEEHPIRTSFVQRLPLVREHYRLYLPLFPKAIESLDLSGYDLVLSVSHCAAKGAVPPTGTVSICICLTPMRYAWDQFDSYFPPRTVRRALVTPFINRLRKWDRETSDRVQHFVAISEFVAGRIKHYYGRQSVVIYPPVDLSRFTIAPHPPEDYYLIVSAFAPYKRLDIAIEAFKGLDRKLKIIGEGQHERQLEKMAPRNVEFLGALPDEEVACRLSRCRALLFPGVEDFGIVPVESLASGRPVIAFAAGGILETVEDGKTGFLFAEQTPASLVEAIHRSENLTLEPEKLREAAQKFDADIFKQKIGKLILERMAAADRSREL
ncbi:MAG: glycosyltransferase [Candidatus Coatesbacteria bacterium]|nr:glycosyltransferase [Candidatus Coatesbacteria bacterium]